MAASPGIYVVLGWLELGNIAKPPFTTVPLRSGSLVFVLFLPSFCPPPGLVHVGRASGLDTSSHLPFQGAAASWRLHGSFAWQPA